jgi:hypothetical protein
MHSPEALYADLVWRQQIENRWQLYQGRRRFGRVIPDSKNPGMWRTVLAGGRLSGMANLSRAKDAVLAAAERELAYEAATDPSKSQENEGVFRGLASPVRKYERDGGRQGRGCSCFQEKSR